MRRSGSSWSAVKLEPGHDVVPEDDASCEACDAVAIARRERRHKSTIHVSMCTRKTSAADNCVWAPMLLTFVFRKAADLPCRAEITACEFNETVVRNKLFDNIVARSSGLSHQATVCNSSNNSALRLGGFTEGLPQALT